jgi:Ribbon-helix-helix protein, copG family
MTKVLTVRVPSGLLAKIDQRAAHEGRGRSEYVRRLIENHAQTDQLRKKTRFACLHLKGRYPVGRGSDNAAIRAAFKRRAHEKNS